MASTPVPFTARALSRASSRLTRASPAFVSNAGGHAGVRRLFVGAASLRGLFNSKHSLPTVSNTPRLSRYSAVVSAAPASASSLMQVGTTPGLVASADDPPLPRASIANVGDNAVTKAAYYGGDDALRAKVTIVRTREEAQVAVRALYAATSTGAVHACDTEVMDIDLKEVGPVGNGHVTCVSVFSGPFVDYGDGAGKALWIDNLDEAGGLLQEFKAWFEDESQPKVWHNYGFDRHVMYNEDIDCRGFAGDTMHMARLADSSRDKATGGGAGYSLESLTSDIVGRRKVPMKELFGVGHLLKDGTESRVKVLPAIEDLQRGSVHAWHRNSFVEYSAFDAEGTWYLHEALSAQLLKLPWVERASNGDGDDGSPSFHSLKEYNDLVMVPFGETLTDMERRGIKVDAHNYLAKVQVTAMADKERLLAEFMDWAEEVGGPDARHMNPQSGTQMQTFLFGGAPHQKAGKEPCPKERVIKIELSPEEVAELEQWEAARDAHADGLAREADEAARISALSAMQEDNAAAAAAASAAASETTSNGATPSSQRSLPKGTAATEPWSPLPLELSTCKVPELKLLLKARGLKVSGTKAVLIARLEECRGLGDSPPLPPPVAAAAAATSSPAPSMSPEVIATAAPTTPPPSHPAPVPALQDLYSSMSDEDLRDAACGRILPGRDPSLNRDGLLRLLRNDDAYARGLLAGRVLPDWVAPASRRPSQGASSSQSAASITPPAAASSTTTVTSAVTSAASSSSLASAAAAARPVPSSKLGGRSAAATAKAAGAAAGAEAREEALEAHAVSDAVNTAKWANVVGRRGGKRYREVTIRSLGLKPTKYTAAGLPATSMDVLRDLAGPLAMDGQGLDPEKHGKAYEYFGGGEAGLRACSALDALCRMGSIDTMLSSFILPLQKLADHNSRVHCSLNFNTETGRLSSRRPNLQNQPALEKDQYKIRDAFTCEPGNMLIVADYGQLELRLMAHMTDCKSMIDAFKSGGCFHSRTAVGMYPHVQAAVDSGEVLLEWDYSKGQPTVPLVKDQFGSERRKAKTLNFSIAYGKTPHGLSKDWGISVEEADAQLQLWYADRPEVKAWQEKTIRDARRTGATRTLCGRYRTLNDITSPQRGKRGHAERAAINTPIQGGAADIVMLAMVKINKSPLLQKLGYQLLLQIHDEVILEGPEEHVEEALAEVRRCMEQPWDESGIGLSSLQISLDVDGKYEKTWYKAK